MRNKLPVLLLMVTMVIGSFTALTLTLSAAGPADMKRRVAFHSKRSGNWDIWVMDADGKNLRQLIADPAGDRGLAWSPMAMAIVLPRPS